jgi:hypothetical protein
LSPVRPTDPCAEACSELSVETGVRAEGRSARRVPLHSSRQVLPYVLCRWRPIVRVSPPFPTW